MTMYTIAVVQFGELWRVVQDDGRHGDALPYGDAVKYAERLARLARWQGYDVEVLVHRDGELRPHMQLTTMAKGANSALPRSGDRTAPGG